jgi:hypothetical protein
MTDTTTGLLSHDLRVALDPGLFPDPVLLGLAWDELAELREEHVDTLAKLETARAQVAEASVPYRAAGTPVPAHPPADSPLFKAHAALHAAQAEAEQAVAGLLDDARGQLPAWRAVEHAKVAERNAEIERLRVRLAELETEDMTAKRLGVWLDRLDPDKITPGLIPWAQLTAIPAPPDRPIGPIVRSLQPQPMEDTT